MMMIIFFIFQFLLYHHYFHYYYYLSFPTLFIFQDNDVHNIRHVSLGDHILKDKRVLVIGDVHGCMQNLLEVLEKAAVLTNDGSEKIINNAVVILAGDTINKGPDNLKVLR